jgi:hypothetical protein
VSKPKNPAFDPQKGAVVGKRGPGRPAKLDDARKKILLKLLAEGQYRKHACALAGVHPNTLITTMRADPAFKEAVQKAEVQAVAAAVRCMSRFAKKDWKAAKAFLAAKDPARWSEARQEPAGAGVKSEVVDALLAKLSQPDAPPAALPPPGGPPDAVPSLGP